MPTRIDNLTPYAAELLDFGGAAPAAGKGLVWDGEGKLVAADVVVQSDLSDYATTSALSAHTAATDNPHEVTAEQVGAYTTTQVDGLISAITYSDVGAAAAVHTHAISDVTGLQDALDGKLSTSGGSVSYLDLSGFPSSARLISGMVPLEGIGVSAGVLVRNTADTVDLALRAGALRAAEIYVGFTPSAIKIKDGAIDAPDIRADEFHEANQPLRERYTRHFLNLESTADLTTLPAEIGDQATVQTGDANDPIHRYELMGDDLDDDTYATPAENLANWRRIVALDADGEIKGPLLNRLVLDTDDTDVARIGEIVCVVDDLDNPTTVSYRMGDGTTKTASLPEIATVTP